MKLAGNDRMSLNSVRAADDFWALLGEGDDSLEMQYSVADVLTLDGGNGYDNLVTSIPGPVNQQITRNWEVINGRWIFWGSFGDDFVTLS